MQQVVPNPTQTHPTTTHAQPLSVTWEIIAYFVIAFLMTFFLLADVDTVPMSNAEATRTLTNWHTLNPTSAQIDTPASPLLFLTHAISFNFLGISEFSARLPGLLAGLALVLIAPTLIRPLFGRRFAFLVALIFAFSPFVLITSRSADPMLFATLGAIVWLWALWRHWQAHHYRFLGFASVAFTCFFFLSAPYAPLLFVVILMAFASALWWTLATDADPDDDTIPDQRLADVRAWLASWQITPLVIITFVTVFVLATLFMLQPSGLAHVAQLLQQTFQPHDAPSPTWLALIVYDPLFFVLALLGAFVAFYRAQFDFPLRFAFLWLVLALLIIALFNPPMSALLWLVPPGAILIASLLDLCLEPMADDTYDFIGTWDVKAFMARYWWVKWLVALCVATLTLLLSFHWQQMARHLLMLPLNTGFASAVPVLFEPIFIQFRYNAIWFIIGVLFAIVSFFLFASLWGTRNTWQGYGMGFFAFALLSGLGGGFHVSAVPGQGDGIRHAPRIAEIWHAPATEANYALLRETLLEVAHRDTSGFTTLPVHVVVDDPSNIDPLILWTFRDFTRVTYTTHLSDVARQQVILTTDAQTDPDLGGTYVGQSFVIRTHWTPANLQGLDGWAWLANRGLRPFDFDRDRVILWLRQDVFEGVPPVLRP